MMLRKAASKIAWVGRTASMVFGLALVLGLVFGVATMALGANGSNFILGQVNNTATALTKLTANVQGPAMQVQNTNPGTDDEALALTVQPGEAPMRVNSTGRVANLNADKLDGLEANTLIRVASFGGRSSLPSGQNGTVATTQITAPAAGFLVITGGSNVRNYEQREVALCFIEVDDGLALSSGRFIELDGDQDVNQEEDCSTNAVVPVSAGQHTVDLEATNVEEPSTAWDYTALSALYVPFGATGSPPSQAAVSAAREEAQGVQQSTREEPADNRP